LFFSHRLVVFIQNLRIYPVEFFFWQSAEKLPAKIERLFHASVFFYTLSDISFLEFLSEFQIFLVDRREFILTDYGRQISCIANLGVGGEELICQILMILSCIALTDAVFHQTGK